MENNQNVKLIQLNCPSCGGKLVAEDTTKKLVCQSCNNLVIPVVEPKTTTQAIGTMMVKVDGINNAASGIAFIDQYFENFEWESFQLDPSMFSVPTVDRLVENLKTTSADNPQTWLVQFEAIATPIEKKLSGIHFLEEQLEILYEPNVINEAFSKFDNLQSVVKSLLLRRHGLIKSLDKTIELFRKYGGEVSSANQLKKRTEKIQESVDDLKSFTMLEEMPIIIAKKTKIDQAISKKLKALKINAEETYTAAKSAYDKGEYTQALNLFLTLEGFQDAHQYIQKIQRDYQFDTYLEISNKPYLFDGPLGSNLLNESKNLYRIEDGIGKQPSILNKVRLRLQVYGNKFFYINTKSEIVVFNQLDNSQSIIGKFVGDLNNFRSYNNTSGTQERFLVYKETKPLTTQETSASNPTNPNPYYLAVLDYAKESFEVLLTDIQKLVDIVDEKIVYYSFVFGEKERLYNTEKQLLVYDITSSSSYVIGDEDTHFQEFYQHYVMLLQKQGSLVNYDLLALPYQTKEDALIIERNVYDYFKAIDDRFYYNVGNEDNHSLISNGLNESTRIEVLRYMKEILFTQGQYLFILQGNQYRLGLIRFDIKTSKTQLVISDLEQIYDFKYGYIFYKDSDHALCRVRIDGANQQVLSDDVGDLVTIKNNFIYYSIDEVEPIQAYSSVTGSNSSSPTIAKSTPLQQGNTLASNLIKNLLSKSGRSILNTAFSSKKVRSLYRMNADGHAKQKLAYDIVSAKEHDDQTIDYITMNISQKQSLYRLNTETLDVTYITNLEKEKEIYLLTI
jgi:uncharacterized protein YbaR (Trm112 family)